MKRVAIATLGCKTNQFESAAISEQFKNAGYTIVPITEPADIYVINSCTVTAKTDSETRRIIRRVRRLNPDARIIATGCYAQVSPDELAQMPEVDVVLGNMEKLDASLLLNAEKDQVSDSAEHSGSSQLKLSSFAEHTRAFLQIQNGCNSFCSYCIVPYARGRSRSVPTDEVLDGIRRLQANNFREIVLTGIHLGAYGLDLDVGDSLETLIRRILSETEISRLRIGSVDPNEFSDELIEICSGSERICHHFHVPLQSGCNSVLTRMGRNYNTDNFRTLIDKISKAMPDSFIGTDIIAGFPGETEDEFNMTVGYVSTLPFSDMHVFPYSKRSGTEAAQMKPQLQPSLISKRAAQLRDIATGQKTAFLARQFGCELNVLGQVFNEKTGLVRGVSGNYVTAEFKGNHDDCNVEQTIHVIEIKDSIAVCRKTGLFESV